MHVELLASATTTSIPVLLLIILIQHHQHHNRVSSQSPQNPKVQIWCERATTKRHLQIYYVVSWCAFL